MIIKDYEIKDYEEVMNLHKKAMIKIGAYKGAGEWDNDLLDIPHTYLENNGEFIIGICNNKIIAMGAFRDNKDNYAEIKRMRVCPDFQGHGYSKMIYWELERRAVSRFKGFFLETSDIQTTAQRLYLSVGFKEIERRVIDNFNCIIYEKNFI